MPGQLISTALSSQDGAELDTAHPAAHAPAPIPSRPKVGSEDPSA